METRRQLLNQVQIFNFVTAREAPTYRAILAVFKQARERYRVQLRPAEVLAGLKVGEWFYELGGPEVLDQRLDQLVEWGALDSAHDRDAVERIDDFYRRRLVYRLTTEGEAAHEATLRVEQVTGQSGALQSGMLERVRLALKRFAADADHPPATEVWSALTDLEAAFSSLTEQASRFIAELDRFVASSSLEDDLFLRHKEALLAYISGFIERLRLLSGEIVKQLQGFDAERRDGRFLLAVQAAELPPPLRADDDPQQRWLQERRQRWEGIERWFLPLSDTRSMVERLAEVAQRNVLALMRALRRMEERRRRPTDPGADFRRLAQWFAECKSDEEAHTLYLSAFGLSEARHFHLAEEDAELVRFDTSWWTAPPVEVPLYLRSQKRPTRTAGRASRARDHSRHRLALAAQVQAAQRARDASIHRIRRAEATHLSALGPLQSGDLEVLLELLSDALTGQRAKSGQYRATTRDGRWEVTLQPSPNGTLTTVHTPDGHMRCEDYLLQVQVAR